MEHFFGALSNLTRGCDFGDREASIVCDVSVFNLKNKEAKKQLCMKTISLGEVLTFSVVRERGELMYKRVIGGIPRFGKNLTVIVLTMQRQALRLRGKLC